MGGWGKKEIALEHTERHGHSRRGTKKIFSGGMIKLKGVLKGLIWKTRSSHYVFNQERGKFVYASLSPMEIKEIREVIIVTVDVLSRTRPRLSGV